MKAPIRIVHLEDNPLDAELVASCLGREEGFAFHLRRVATRADFAAALQEGDFDLILSDYNLPLFDGLAALRLVQERGVDVPFIFVSGAIKEEQAIESLKNGATDYIFKENLARLVPAVRRALQEAEDRRQRQHAEQSRAQLVAILEATTDFVGIADPGGHVLYINRAGRKMVGLMKEEDNVHHPIARFHPEWAGRKIMAEGIPAAIRHGVWEGETALLDGACHEIPVSQMILAHKTPDGSVAFLSTILRDITERKRAELRQSAQRAVLELIVSGGLLVDILNAIVVGIEDEVPGMAGSVLLLDPETKRLHFGAAPHLPDDYQHAIEGLVIGPRAGSCGTACHRAERVIVTDIATDPLWQDFRELALPHQLRACWSEPIFSERGQVLGAFALYAHAPRPPQDHDLRALETAGRMAAIAIERRQAETALRNSEERFRQVAENSADVIWMFDAKFQKLVYVNRAYETVWGRSCESLYRNNRSFLDAVHPDDRGQMALRVARLSEGIFESAEYRIRQPDGSIRWIRDRAFAIRDSSGRVYRAAGIAEDITERKRAEQLEFGQRQVLQLVATGQPLDTIMEFILGFVEKQSEGGRCSILLLDPMEQRLRFGAAPSLPGAYHRKLEGLAIGPGTGSSGTAAYLREMVVVADIASDPICAATREQALSHGLQACTSCPILAGNGEVLGTFDIYYLSPREPGAYEMKLLQTSSKLLSIAIERRRAEDSLRELSGHLLQSQDEERRRIARELHDTTAQNLAAMAMNLSVLKDLAPETTARMDKVLTDTLRLAEKSSQEIRTLSYLLHPPLLDEVGLTGAVTEYASGFARRSGIVVNVVISPRLGRLPMDVELALFRVVQESLGNVHRHSRSPTATIRVVREPESVWLEVEDVGQGMTGDRALGPAVKAEIGVGIAGMRERVRQLGGQLEIDSGPHGTVVRAMLPLRQNQRDPTCPPSPLVEAMPANQEPMR